MGAVATLVACVVPIVLCVVLANSDRGLGGTIAAGYESLTSISKKTPGGPSRLLSASSSRGSYWHEAKEVFGDHYWKGSGAETFAVTRLRYRAPNDRTVPQHAHGYLHQTAADLGIAGLALSLALLVAWLVQARRATGVFHRRERRPAEFTPERVGLIALALCAVVFGLHSAVDWVWYVPGPAAMALAAAGFVVGRGALGRARGEAGVARVATAASNGHGERAAAASAAPVATPAPVAVGAGVEEGAVHKPPPSVVPLSELPPPAPPPPPADPPPEPRHLPPALARSLRPGLAVLTLALTALCAWAIWQPLRSDRESDRALDLAANNHLAAARQTAQRAHEIDPLAVRPYVVRNAVEDAAGNPYVAQKALEDAVLAFPADPQTWIQLAQYQLNSRNRPADALKTVAGALYLDPQSRAAQTVYFQANAALNGAPAPVAPPASQPGVPVAPAPPAPAPGTGGTSPHG
jgi:hypothetical protein